MKKIIITTILLTSFVSTAFAVNILQVGVRDGGVWVLNSPNPLSSPTEDETAVTSGSSLSVAGQYKNADVLLLGGKYSGTFGTGQDWSSFDLPELFNGKGAILIASVPETKGSGTSLKVDGALPFHRDASLSYFPNDHAPVKSGISDFLFFDLGNFTNSADLIPDFQSSPPYSDLKDGEIMDLILSDFGDLAWIHFDVIALETSKKETGPGGMNVSIASTLENNPGSHDVTWKNPGDGGFEPQAVVPEPSTILLLGAGLVALGYYGRNKV